MVKAGRPKKQFTLVKTHVKIVKTKTGNSKTVVVGPKVRNNRRHGN